MCRLVGWVARAPLTAQQVLGDDGLAALRRLALLHGDGWGASSEGSPGAPPVVERSPARADIDPAFAAATTGRSTRVGTLHLRWATPGLPVRPENTHPFSYGTSAFAHNGAVAPFDRLGELLDDPWRARLRGTTDSEHYFLAVLADLERGGDVVGALDRVTARLARDYVSASLNALLHTPDALYAVNCHDPGRAPLRSPARLGTRGQELLDDHGPYFDLRYRVTDESVTVVSSGVVPAGTPGWRLMEPDTVLVVDRETLAVREVPLSAGLGRRPSPGAPACGTASR